MPPSSDWSLPMTAFRTTLDSKKITTKSKVFQICQTSLARQPKQHDDQRVHDNGAQDLFGKRDLLDQHVVPHCGRRG